MRKNVLVLIAATVILVFGACSWEMPKSIEVRAKPKLNLPVDPELTNLSKILFDNIKGAMGETEDILVLDYLDFKSKQSKKSVQTFLINYSISPQDADLSLDFTEQLKLVDNMDFDMDDFNMEIPADGLDDFEDMEIDPIEITFGLGSLFTEIEEKIRARFGSTAGNNRLSMNLPIVGGGITVPSPITFGSDTISFTAIMEEADFYEGYLIVEMRIEEPTSGSSALSAANITFDNVAIVAKNSLDRSPQHIIGTEYEKATETIYTNSAITLTGSNPSKHLIFDLENSIIDGDFQMVIGTYTDNSGSPGAVQLVLHPDDVEDLKFREVRGLNIGECTMDIEESTLDLDIDEDLFVHAVVGTGTLSFEVDPEYFEPTGYDTYGFDLEGFSHSYEINLNQTDRLYKTVTYHGLGGESGKATFTDTNSSLDGQDIVPGKDNLNILPNSKFVLIPQQGASFRIADRLQYGHPDNNPGTGEIDLDVKPKLNVEEFSVVHIDISEKMADPDFQPEPQIISMEESAKYLKWINFTKVGPILTFDEVDITGLTIKITETNLDIGGEPQPIVEGPMDYFVNTTGKKLYLQDDGPNSAVDELEFIIEVNTDLAMGGGVVAIPNVDPKEPNIKFKMGEITFVSEWDQMQIDADNFGKFDGSFPSLLTDEDGNPILDDDGNPVYGDPIDLSSLGEFLKGFEFTELESYLYISGPDVFFGDKLKPTMEIKVAYTDYSGGGDNLLDDAPLVNAGQFNLDPKGTGTFKGNLPTVGKRDIDLESVMRDLPKDLRFEYKVKMADAIITPEDLEDLEDNDNAAEDKPLKLDIVLVLPLILEATADEGATISLSNINGEKDPPAEGEPPVEGDPPASAEKSDLLGREAGSEDSWFSYIKSLVLKLELNNNAFKNGAIQLDDREKDPDTGEPIDGTGRVMKFSLKGKELNLPIKGKNLDYINDTIPWDPDIGIHFDKGGTLEIPRNLGAVRIKFDADIQAKIDL